jgi:outer membrane immunogenic protein
MIQKRLCICEFATSETNGSSDADYWDGSKTRSGVTFLTGVEYAIDPNWSAKIQYNYYDFGTKTVRLLDGDTADVPGYPGFDIDTKLRIHAITAGVNYRFNWGKTPIVAKY